MALWREALLARAVLRGRTRGYRHHPQLMRFRAQRSPRRAISAYLAEVHQEATRRGYVFDRSKIGPVHRVAAIPVTRGQLELEWRHLLAKLAVRDRARNRELRALKVPDPHPLFRALAGSVETWERASPVRRMRGTRRRLPASLRQST